MVLCSVFIQACCCLNLYMCVLISCACQLHLSLLTRGAEGEASIKLPPSVTASYHGANVTVRVPSWTATYGNKASSEYIHSFKNPSS